MVGEAWRDMHCGNGVYPQSYFIGVQRSKGVRSGGGASVGVGKDMFIQGVAQRVQGWQRSRL